MAVHHAPALREIRLGGTAVLPNLYFSQKGYLGQIYHVVSQIGLLLIAADLLGRQRVWPSLIGLVITAWCRQMTLLYALPILWMAWRRKRLKRQTSAIQTLYADRDAVGPVETA